MGVRHQGPAAQRGRELLAASPVALNEAQIVERYTGRGPWKKRLPDLLATLEALARARCDGGVWRGRERCSIPTEAKELSMNDTVAELAARGLALAPDERARLAAMLLDSLDSGVPSDVEAAWDTEIARRLAAFDRGDMQAIDAEAVFAKARAIAR